jgi:hypothetical protein
MKWDDEIAEMDLSDIEKDGLQVFRNYERTFRSHRAKKAIETADLDFDLEGFQADIANIESSPIVTAILASASVADELLRAMFQRHGHARLQMRDMLAPLGPLGDFNKRLKVAALAEFIDEDDLAFFDELRKLRNSIAHSRRPKEPTRAQIERVIQVAPEWLDALVAHERIHLPTDDRHTETVLKAGMVMHLSKLAWMTLLGPLAKQAGLSVSTFIDQPPPIFGDLARCGIYSATGLLNAEIS